MKKRGARRAQGSRKGSAFVGKRRSKVAGGVKKNGAKQKRLDGRRAPMKAWPSWERGVDRCKICQWHILQVKIGWYGRTGQTRNPVRDFTVKDDGASD